MDVESLNFSTDEDFGIVKSFVIDHKEEFKNKKLGNTLLIKGIGDKFLKIENNYYSWDEINNALKNYKMGAPVDDIVLSILSWLYEGITVSDSYIPRKFDLNENFSNVKEEILSHKSYYKKGLISGIGVNNLKITTNKGKDYYIEWEELEKIVDNIKYSSFDDLEDKRFSSSIIRQLFNDNSLEYSDDEVELLNEENGKVKLKFYKYCKKGLLSYKVIKNEIEEKKIRKIIVKSALEWNNGQLPISIDDEGVNHVILSKSSLVRADLRFNERFTKMINDELDLDLKVYATEYGDEYIYHVHQYHKLIKFERDCSKWTVTYNNKNLLQNAFRKSINTHWNCDITTAKSTEVCTVVDYDNMNNVFDPDLFIKLYEEHRRK